MTTPARTLDDLRRTASLIKADMEADVAAFEGKPFDGRTVGELHGNLAAGISALAGMVATLADHIEAAIESHVENSPHLYADGSS